MTLRTNVTGADNYVLQEAISAYSDEAYTNARKLTGTGIIGPNPNIDTSTETFIGQVRWYKPLNPVINTASLTDPTNGSTTSFGSDYLNYVKTVRTHGASKVNLQQVVTQADGLAKVGRDFGETRAQDEHNAILAVLKGVAISEALNGAATGSGSTGLGGQTFENDPASKRHGFYVDLGANKPVVAATAALHGAARAEGFLQAFAMAYKDYEPEYAYLVTSPEVMASLRSANLIESTTVTEANVTFQTIFGGKFRIIQTRASQGMSTAELAAINTGAGVDIVGTKTSFIVLPGSLAQQKLSVPNETEIGRTPAAFKGGGTTEIWYRWGYVLAPAGYNWNGSQEAFPTDDDYRKVAESGTQKALTGITTIANVRGNWDRKTTSALSLGILPVFHS